MTVETKETVEEETKEATTMDHNNNNDNGNKHSEDHNQWRIVLYYCYIDIERVDDHVGFHRNLCQEQGLQGRIRVSHEGINGVLSGPTARCQLYEDRLRAELVRLVPDDTAWELDCKYCRLRTDLPVRTQLFDSLICKATDSVVSLFGPSNNNNNAEKKKQGFSKQTNRRRRRQQQRREQQHLEEEANGLPNLQELADQVPAFPGGRHLSPQEWNEKLCRADDAIILDCRNVYESNVGYFQAPDTNKVATLLTNTRKYSDLPKVLAQSKDQWVHKKQIFSYCTGGVRCEQASKFIQALVAKEHQGDDQQQQQQEVEVYQLHGGIQRYLEHFGNNSQSSTLAGPTREAETETGEVQVGEEGRLREGSTNQQNPCLYRGLNFVFDPRRTDPMVDSGATSIGAGSSNSGCKEKSCVGRCCLCGTPHDDYDNGHAPIENQEARCCKCRILLLVCTPCRQKVQCWGEDKKEGLPKLFCGIDACSDYQVTGRNPTSIISA